jgi:mRNA interferase RelE/StbE
LNWRVDLDRRAERELQHLPDAVLQRIADRLTQLEENPFPRGSKKLKGGGGYRLRVGDYRVLYDVFPAKRTVVIYACRHLKHVYRG